MTVFGLGAMRPAPGTWGSLPPVLMAAALIAGGLGPHQSPFLYHLALATVCVAFSAACVVQGDRAEAHFGYKDPSNVVADETAGQCLPLLGLPAAALANFHVAAFTLLYAFVAFRMMDIVKPWPARGLQRIPGGWGILIDDLIAGVYAAVMVQLMTRLMLS
ncbi:MAG: phosphatidylglycerophosphatase A [Planctomycetes bacterium]|nr:phosphatidylglycerophosphatase A [Planctomycetota bacterium]